MKLTTKKSAAAGLLLAACTAVQAASIQMSYGTTAGEASRTAVAALGTSGRFVTTLINGAGNFEAIAWYNNEHQVQRLGSYTAGPANSGLNDGEPVLGVAALSANQFVAALLDFSDDFMELIVFGIDRAGNLTRQSSVIVKTGTAWAYSISIAPLDSQRVVTTSNELWNNSTVNVWIVDSQGIIQAQGPPVTLPYQGDVAAVAMVNPEQIVIAQNQGFDLNCDPYSLTLTSLSVDSFGNMTQDGAYFAASMVGSEGDNQLQIVPLGNGNFAIAFTDFSNLVDVSLWTASTGGSIVKLAEGSPFSEAMLALASLAGNPFTIGSSVEGSYRADAWTESTYDSYISVANETIPWTSCNNADYNNGCWASAASLPGGQAVTAMIDGNGDLNVSVWTYTP